MHPYSNTQLFDRHKDTHICVKAGGAYHSVMAFHHKPFVKDMAARYVSIAGPLVKSGAGCASLQRECVIQAKRTP